MKLEINAAKYPIIIAPIEVALNQYKKVLPVNLTSPLTNASAVAGSMSLGVMNKLIKKSPMWKAVGYKIQMVTGLETSCSAIKIIRLARRPSAKRNPSKNCKP